MRTVHLGGLNVTRLSRLLGFIPNIYMQGCMSQPLRYTAVPAFRFLAFWIISARTVCLFVRSLVDLSAEEVLYQKSLSAPFVSLNK